MRRSCSSLSKDSTMRNWIGWSSRNVSDTVSQTACQNLIGKLADADLTDDDDDHHHHHQIKQITITILLLLLLIIIIIIIPYRSNIAAPIVYFKFILRRYQVGKEDLLLK